MEAERATSESFVELYNTYAPAVTRYLIRLTGSRDEAEDLAQETFLKALRHWEQLEDGANVPSWLFRIARNTAYDTFRRRRRNPALRLPEGADEWLAAADQESSIGEAEPILAALKHLPARYRVPLLMHSVAGYPVEQIAATLGWKVGTVKSRLYRARARFRAHYAGP
jgi:RNA polymerase sigma-70 factor (ECF subfamily)